MKSNLKAPETETGVALDNMGEAVRPLQGNLSNQEATINFSQVSELKSDLGLAEEEKVEAAMPEEGGEAAAQRTIGEIHSFIHLLYALCQLEPTIGEIGK